jgi:nitroreductase
MPKPAIALEGAWNINAAEFPESADVTEKLRFLLRYAVLAPSPQNSQPWRFRIHGDTVDLFADLSRHLGALDPERRELIMSCGAVLHHLRTAAKHFGYRCSVDPFPPSSDANLVATFTLLHRRAPGRQDELLFSTVPLRTTNRMPFADRPVPKALRHALEDAAWEEGALLLPIENEEDRRAIAELVSEAGELEFVDAHRRADASRWVRHEHEFATDGIPARVLADQAEWAAPRTLRSQIVPAILSADAVFTGAPMLAAIATADDTRPCWLCAGQALDRVLLRAAADGVFASFLSAVIELPQTREQLRYMLGTTAYPQLLLRMGYGEPVPHTPRRPLADFLI